MTDVDHLKRLNRMRDADLGEGNAELDVPVTAEMVDAGVRAALQAELYPGDAPFSELTILRIYIAMERLRISGK